MLASQVLISAFELSSQLAGLPAPLIDVVFRRRCFTVTKIVDQIGSRPVILQNEVVQFHQQTYYLRTHLDGILQAALQNAPARD